MNHPPLHLTVILNTAPLMSGPELEEEKQKAGGAWISASDS